jgi:pimeloyl-ACP methyl ester carboxylesterase
MADTVAKTDRVGTSNDTAIRSYAPVNDLRMYYEIHGAGRPLLLLHGGPTTIDSSFGAILPSLAETRQVIAVEQQGHGHTADIDRPLSFEQMADDTAALLRHLGIEQVDVFGYSDGGNVGLGLAIRHPDLVRKLAIAGTNYNNDGLYPEFLAFFERASPDDLGELREAYEAVAPRPGDWPTLVAKVKRLGAEFAGWRPEDIRAIEAPTLVIIGDSDIVRPEHAVELFRLLSHAQLAVLPGIDHVALVERADWLLSMIAAFLDAPMPERT